MKGACSYHWVEQQQMKQSQPNKKKVLTIDSDAMAMTSEVTALVNFFFHHVICASCWGNWVPLFRWWDYSNSKKRDFDQTKQEVSIKSFNDIFEICWWITRFGNEKNVNFSCGSAIAAIGFDVGRCWSVYQRHMLTADYL